VAGPTEPVLQVPAFVEQGVAVTTTRRDFLKLLGVGAASTTLSASGLYVPPEEEKVRRYWQVGASLSRSLVCRTSYDGLYDSDIFFDPPSVAEFRNLHEHPNVALLNAYLDENVRLVSFKSMPLGVQGLQPIMLPRIWTGVRDREP
jgi:hypothetical protein